MYGGRTKVEGCRREEWEEEFEEAIATEFGEVVAGPLRSRREMPGISSSRKNKAWRGMGVGAIYPLRCTLPMRSLTRRRPVFSSQYEI